MSRRSISLSKINLLSFPNLAFKTFRKRTVLPRFFRACFSAMTQYRRADFTCLKRRTRLMQSSMDGPSLLSVQIGR